jgi:hypothetical protein
VTRRNRKLETHSDRLYRASDIVPQVLDHLSEQRAQTSAVKASVTDGSITSTGDPTDPTGDIVCTLERFDAPRRDIFALIDDIGRLIDRLDDACRKALGIRSTGAVTDDTPAVDKPLCIDDEYVAGHWAGERRDGDGKVVHIGVWVEPQWVRCGRNAEHFVRADGTVGFRNPPRCAMHRKRAERAQRGLPPEEDVA